MRRRINLTVILAMCFSGIIGGAIGSIFTQKIVYAKHEPNAITARSLNIVDKHGKSRIGIGMEDGNPVIYLTDNQGNVRAYWAISSRGPQIIFREKSGKANIFLASEDKKGASLSFMANNGKPRVMMSYFPNKGTMFGLFDEKDSAKAVISVLGNDSSVALLRPNKKLAIAMTNRASKGSLLSIWNSSNDPCVSLGLTKDKPGLFIYEKYRTGLLFNMAGGRPALALMDHGSPIWSATSDVPPTPELPPMDDMMRELTR